MTAGTVQALVGGWVADRCGVLLGDAVPAGSLGVADVLELALRRNPRRAHLLVSTVLGKHLPVDPRVARAAGLTLGLLAGAAVCEHRHADPADCLLDAGRPDVAGPVAALLDALHATGAAAAPAASRARDSALAAADTLRAEIPGAAAWVLGFGETATGLGQAVAEVLGAPALHSTRRPGAAPVAAVFTEAHSHAQAHSITAPAGLLRRPGVGVLVDDELSTGRTALNAIRALHAVRPRERYVLAVLVDVRDPGAVAELGAGVRALGARLCVVSLARGVLTLPADLPATAARALSTASVGPAPTDPTDPTAPTAPTAPTDPVTATPVTPTAPGAPVRRVDACWPGGLPDGARLGLPASLLPAVVGAARHAALLVGRAVRSAGPVLVLGTEEHLDVPLRVAEALADAGATVRFSSTTRSPVAPVDDPGYPIRTALSFPGHDEPADGAGRRFAYNVLPAAGSRPWAAVVLVVDRGAATPALDAPGGLVDGLGSAAGQVLVLTTGCADPTPAPQDPLRGPQFGSYAPADVGWLLTDLSGATLEAPAADREELIQSGRSHYAESLPIEYQPSAGYQRLFDEALATGARRVALSVGLLAGLLQDRHGRPAALVSLARAGTPVGVLLRRWFARAGLDVPHLSVSIVRGRGIDLSALRWVAARHDASRCVFVDGWTGKGAIARELAAAVATVISDGPAFDPEIAVLADPGGCTSLYGTREDWLIPSSCLNSTVSGLVSRTVLNDELIGPGDHHGAKFYAELATVDRSTDFLDAVTASFDEVGPEVAALLPALLAADRSPTWAGWAAVTAVAERFGIDNLNLVKPGVGETTRVLLRRVPWQVLVRDQGHPDLAHIERLAAERGVPVTADPDLPYACIGLIRPAPTPGGVNAVVGGAATG